MDSTNDFLQKASVRGYRTLLMAMRVLEESEVNKFVADCAQAELDLKNREKILDKIFNDIEQELFLIGGTVVEDRLQDRVPETIAEL
jgi:phospholipid-translocating ATPase